MNRHSLAATCFVVGGLLGSCFVAPMIHGQSKTPVPPIPREMTSYRDVVKRILPAVVSLDAQPQTMANAARSDGDTVSVQVPGEAPKASFGSGVIIDARGIVLTSLHVVEGAQAVEVTLADGRKIISRDIRGDRKTDVAIVVLDGKGGGPFPYLELGDSDAMEIGDRVLAVGAPFGLFGSVTHGIISGKGRNGLKLNDFEDFLQTDAAINPGNSGGPLISLDAKVIGITAAIKSKNGGFQGVGLAVASNLCKPSVTGLINEGTVRRGYLGLQVRELTPAVAAKFKQGGVAVAEVYDKSPAAKAGIKAGDIITSFAGRSVPDTKTLQTIVIGLPLQKEVPVVIQRNGKSLNLRVTIEELPPNFGVERELEHQPQALLSPRLAEWSI
jgi:serine protease Do